MLIFAVLSMLFTLPATAAGPGGGGGGSGGDTGGEAPEDFSELVVALREVTGEPILRGPFTVIDEHTGEAVDEYCVQPVSPVVLPGMDGTDAVTNPVDGRSVWKIPLNADLDPLDPELEICDPQAAYAMYVSEAELERLNMARTSEDVVDQKLADVVERLLVADELTLDGAGRLVIDGAVVDAGPEHAALFQELMKTGTLPALPAGYTDVDGQMFVEPFGAEELAAASIGAAASKFAPISIDAVIYYISNVTKISEVADGLFQQLDPMTGTDLRFLDFSGFSYNRAQTFTGAVTWLDVPTLTWETSRILDRVAFAPIPPIAAPSATPSPFVGAEPHNYDIPGIAGFAQLVDDVRAAILYYHEYEALAGFYMDSPGENTYDEQLAALTAPATDWGAMPAKVVQSEQFGTSASLYLPHAAPAPILDARLRVTVTTDGGFDPAGPVPVSVVAADGQAMPFEVQPTGELIGWWGPATGFTVDPGYRETTDFTAEVLAGAPTGTYDLSLELVAGGVALASDNATLEVLEPHLTAGWVSVTRYVEQSAYAELVTRVFNPVQIIDDIDGVVDNELASGEQVLLTIDPIGETEDAEGTTVPLDFTSPSEATLYSNAVSIPLTLSATTSGALEGMLPIPDLAPGAASEIPAFLVLNSEAPLGWYELTVEVVDSEALPDTTEMYVATAASHGEQPGDFAIAITPVGTPGSDATFELSVVDGDSEGVIFQCKLEKDGEYYLEHGDEPPTTEEEEWKPCTSPKTYTNLPDGEYEFFARGRRGEVFSAVVTHTWVVTDGGTGGGGGGGGTDPGTDPTDPTDPGDGDGDTPVQAVMTDLAGDDRIATAVEVSKMQFPEAASAAVLANAGVFADALAGTPLAVAKNAPMLLTYTGELDGRVAVELDRVLEPGATVYLLGGTAALSEGVEGTLTGMGYEVVRYAGADRYATSVAIAEQGLGNPTTVFLTTGHVFADGLTAGTAAATVGGAVLLTDGDAMAAAVTEYLAANPADTRYAVGGPAMRADQGADPIVGQHRYETAVRVAERFFGTPAFVGMASGEKFPDALSGGVAAAMNGGPLLLTGSEALSDATAQYLTANVAHIGDVHFYGGTAAMAQQVRDAVASALS